MFRPSFFDPRLPGQHEAYESPPYNGFNTGVNINNYNSFHSDPQPPRYDTGLPRDPFPFDFAPQVPRYRHLHFNDLPPTRTPLHLQHAITVILPSGDRALLNRTHLINLLPRIRNAPRAGRGSVVDLADFLADYAPCLDDIPPATFAAGFTTALAFVIRHVEALSHRRATSLFDRHRGLLARVPAHDQPGLVRELFAHAFFVCCALDQDRALGCADGLALEVARWLLELLPRVQLLGAPEGAVYLFVGLARVFRATGPQVAVLGQFWNALDEEERGVINGIMGEGRRGNAARVLDALRGLRDAGVVD